MTQHKVDPDYMYFNQASNQPESSVFFTDPKVQARKRQSASMCATLAIFMIFLGIGIITFFYIAPLMRIRSGSYYQHQDQAARSRYHGNHHGSSGVIAKGGDHHDNHDDVDSPPPKDGNEHRPYPPHYEQFDIMFGFMRGMSFRGKMCLRRCFRERDQRFGKTEEVAGHRGEKYIWELLIKRTSYRLECLKRCERFAMSPDGETSSTGPSTTIPGKAGSSTTNPGTPPRSTSTLAPDFDLQNED